MVAQGQLCLRSGEAVGLAQILFGGLLLIGFLTPVAGVGAGLLALAIRLSLLPAGVREVEGGFDADDVIEIVGPDGVPFAKGLVRYPAATLRRVAGRQTSELDEGVPHEVVHRDDLVVLPA